MKIYPLKYGKKGLMVLARNLKTCRKVMKSDFPIHKFKKTINHASNSNGELGTYYFEIRTA